MVQFLVISHLLCFVLYNSLYWEPIDSHAIDSCVICC